MEISLKCVVCAVRAAPAAAVRHMRIGKEFTAVASRPPAFEAPVGKGPLKIVVENRNIYEGQYVKIEHVVYVPHETSRVPCRAMRQAAPAWMRSPATRGRAVPRASGPLRLPAGK